MNKFTVLANNHAVQPFSAEHGLSILIELNGKKVLLDTGLGDSLFENADVSDIPLSDIDFLILSHGHYDHGGNLDRILDLNPAIKFKAHSGVATKRFSIRLDQHAQYIGLSKRNLEAINRLSTDQVTWCDKPAEIIPDLWISGTIVRKHNKEKSDIQFYKDKKGLFPDSIDDDMAIWFEGTKGLTIFCGCCHSGLRNTIKHILVKSGCKKINFLVGGFHLKYADEQYISRAIGYLNTLDIDRIIPLHCTGEIAVQQMKNKLHCKVHSGTAGMEVEI